MKYKECPECKSKGILLTQDLGGKLYAATCIRCGWAEESEEFKKLEQEFDDVIKNFDHSELVKTKKKLI